MTLADKARDLAFERHRDMFRKGVGREPITDHLCEVATSVKNAGLPEDAVAAAWLHDIIEDTPTTLGEIEIIFGSRIAGTVEALTDPPHFEGLPLKERKNLQAERLKDKDCETKIIKLCDQISNVRSVLYDPPLEWSDEKSLTYARGAKMLADVCEGLNPDLDREFDELYKKVEQKYKKEKS